MTDSVAPSRAAAERAEAIFAPGGERLRFDRTERNVHWWTAVFVGLCSASSLALTITPVATLVGQRDLVKFVHVVAGLLIPVPLLLGRALPWSARLRRTFRQLDRFDAHDRRWLASFGRDPSATHGKFHPAQKVNSALIGGALVLLFLTGLILRWFEPFPLPIRRGATFVHDWVAFLLAIDLLFHIGKAFADPIALRAMRTGRASVAWAARHHPRWRDGQ